MGHDRRLEPQGTSDSAEEVRAHLAAIVESSDDAIVSKTLDGIITSWNGGAQRMFGYQSDEVIGRPVTILFPADRTQEEETILNRLKRGERVEHYQTIRLRKDGTPIDVSLTVSPVRDREGRIIGASKIARDVTDQKRTHEALKRSEERMRTLVEATPECVKIVAPDGTLVFMNHAGLCMVETDSESMVRGHPVVNLIATEHRERWLDFHRRVCGGQRLSWEFEIVGLKGGRRWMETHAVPLTLDDGRVAQLAVTREVTARKRLERERQQLLENERAARAEAERTSLLKDEFLATLSHELRTPLSAILGWSQVLSMGTPSQSDLEQGLETIQRNARVQTQLIEDLLDMSRIVSGKIRLDVQWTDLASVVEAAVSSLRPAADAKSIRLRTILDPHAGPVSGDPTRLQQVVWNLLSNAIKFTPKGGKVEVLLERVNSHLEITVHDSGMGIKPDLLPVIFERFRQGDASTTRSYGGLGLGLAIVKHLVELHGGTVRAKSSGEGEGATFIVMLPLAPVRDDGRKREHPRTQKAAALDFSEVDLAGVKVLVVDDEPDARALVRRLLAECHADVSVAASAAEAVEQLKMVRPDIIVSDIGMPETDGYQFIRQVRALPAGQGGRTPAIALTAFARSEDRTRAMIAGYQVHVAKPIESQELIVTVASLAGRMGAGPS